MLRPLLLLLASCFFLGLSAQENDCSFGLVLSSAQAEVGEEVTIDVTTRQYEDIVALQYSHHWNPAKLRFIEVLYNPDMDISVANFNLQPEFINAGVLNFAYVEATGAGRDLVDGEALYQLRFELLDAAGADVTITDLAGTIEIIHATELILDNFYFLHSQIGPAGSNPSITTACINGQVCNDPDLGRIAINPNGTEEVSADWSGNGGFTATGTEITSLNGGTYQLELTDGNGNTAHGDFYVAFDSGLDVQLSVDADQCGGPADGAINTTVLGGSSNYTYSWSNGETTANLTDIPAGDYSLTVTDVDLDCSIVASATVASFSQILGFFTATSPACSANDDGALTINVEGPPESFPVTYQWSTGETTAEISGLSAGVYFVTVTDANACESVFSYFLQAEELTFSAELIPGACQDGGGEITILLSGAQYSYLWNTGATTATISDLPDGTYTVTVTDETSGCSASEIYELAGEELVVGVAYECFELDGEALTDMTAIVWNSNDGPYTFDWSTGASEVAVALSTVTVPTAGTYSVTVTSASGCVSAQNDLVAPCGGSSVELYLSPASSSLANGEDRCFAVKANNFNGIGSVQFSLAWDETKLDFLELTNFALEGLSTTNFNTNLTDDGLLAFSWLATDLVNGETLADGGTLFEVCLAANAEEEATTLIDFANFPTPVEITDVTPEVLNFTTEAATVILNGGTNGSDETELSLDDATVMIGEQFCLPVRVAAFTDVIGMQASISWDPQALQFTGVQAFNLPSLTNASFNEFAEAQLEGILRVLWNSPDLLGVSRSDNEALFELCFIATGDAGDYPVDFVDQPLPLQLVTEDFTEIATATSGGLVTIGSQTTDDVRLRIGSTAVAPGELTCVPVEAQAFNDIVAMQFSLNWDDDRIRFDELILVDNELGLEESDFNILSFDGTLSLAWIADNILEPITLAEGTTLFELCYTAQSQEGQAGIIFSTQPTAIEFVRENTLVPFVPTNGTIMVTSDNLVWPGDTNEDGIANNLDVLPLGLGFESTGPSRINPSTSWLPQFAAPWPAATPESSINFRHADTDGDGVISITDTTALSLNWGQTVDEFGGELDPQSSLTGAPIYIEADTIMAGEQVSLPIILGVEEPLEDAYGIAFTLRYDPETVEAGSIHVEADGWLTADESPAILLYRDFPAEGRTEIGLVRTDGQGVGGGGQIAEVIIIMEDVILTGFLDVETTFRIENVHLITANEIELPTSPRETTVLVEGVTSTSEPEWANQLQLSPNPTHGLVQLTANDLHVQELQLIDATGRTVLIQTDELNQIDLTSLPAGMYQLRIATDLGVVYEKLMKI